MLQNRWVCKFPGCDKGTNGKAYETPENMEDQDLITIDLRLHTRAHLMGTSEFMMNGTMGYKDSNERALQSHYKDKSIAVARTIDEETVINPHEKSQGIRRRIGHHIHNGTEWVSQQAEHHPLIMNLCIGVDNLGYESLDFPVPDSVHP